MAAPGLDFPAWEPPTQSTLTPRASAIAGISSAVAEAARLDRRSDGQMRLACGIDRQKAVRAFSTAGRFHALDSAEGHVHQAALAAVHRREGVRDSRPDDLFRSGFCGHAQFLGAKSLEAGGVKADQAALALVKAQNLCGDGL
jgi:hypothetical protein